MIEERLNEKVYFEHLENGLDVILVPKKGATNYYAMYATHFGSLNYKFKAPSDEEITTVPDGVAHFLEHKLVLMLMHTQLLIILLIYLAVMIDLTKLLIYY